MILTLSALLGTEGLTAGDVLWTAVLLVGVFVGSIAAAAVLLVRLPATYFLDGHPRGGWGDRHVVIRWAALVVKNLVGAVLVGGGVLMLVTPGQGALTILIGVMLLDFPGKRRLERKLIGRPAVLRAINRLRTRFGKPPVVLDPAGADQRIHAREAGRVEGPL
jgi:hypothetical protein